MKRAIVILNRLGVNAIDAKTRIGAQINNQGKANNLSHALFLTLVNTLLDFDGDIYICHPPITKGEKFKTVTISGRAISCFKSIESVDILAISRFAIENTIKLGYDQMILTASDVPYLTLEYFYKIFYLLNSHEVVLGPALDHGFNVYGIKPHVNLDWLYSENSISRSNGYQLKEEFIENMKKLHINYYIDSEVYNDVDTFEDVLQFYKDYKNGYIKLPSQLELIKYIENEFFC